MLWRVCAVACGDNDGSLLASAVQQGSALGDFELLAPGDELGTVDRDEGTGA